MTKRPHPSLDPPKQNSFTSKRQQFIDSIEMLDFQNVIIINQQIDGEDIPKYAQSILEQQQKIIEQLSNLLKIGAELLKEQNGDNLNSNKENLLDESFVEVEKSFEESERKKQKQVQNKENISSQQNLNSQQISSKKVQHEGSTNDCDFDNSFDECISFSNPDSLTADSSRLNTSPVQTKEPAKDSTTISTTPNILQNDSTTNTQLVNPSTPLPPIQKQNIYLDDLFMQDLSKYLIKWRKGRLFNFAELDFYNRDFGQYFEINCLVFSITSPSKEDIKNGCPVYLYVCDGTKLASPTKPFLMTEPSYHVLDDLFDGNLNYENMREYVQVFSCFDEFAEQAKALKAGDIIQARNVHVKIYQANSAQHIFNLRGLLNPSSNPFKRGLQLLGRKGKSLFKEKRTIAMI
ncbi:unnamed protein product [Meloidogyne enterolobii]|uniref:Uncharacterized protein n=1 Tax=Meloidogyne enterolobii TaxID=390850 RepID=A0ACB0YGR0_MELEN